MPSMPGKAAGANAAVGSGNAAPDHHEHAARDAAAATLGMLGVAVRDAWLSLIDHHLALPGSIPAQALDMYLDGLAAYTIHPDRTIALAVAKTWCDFVPPSVEGVARTAVSMGLLHEALRLCLPSADEDLPGTGATARVDARVQAAMEPDPTASFLPGSADAVMAAPYTVLMGILPDFAGEFVRGLIRGAEMPPAEGHWFDLAQRLSTEREHRVKQLSILNDVSAAFATVLTQEQLLTTIHAQISRLVDTTNCYVAERGPGPDEMTMLMHVFNGQRDAAAEGQAVSMRLVREVMEGGVPLSVANYVDAIAARGLPQMDTFNPNDTWSWLGVPVTGSSGVLGALVIMTNQGEFPDEDIDILSAVARQAGTALENVRLFDAERQRAMQLRAINQLSRAMATLREPQDLIVTACTMIQQFLGDSLVSVLLPSEIDNALHLCTGCGSGFHHGMLDYCLPLSGHGLIPLAARSRSIIVANDVRSDARYVTTPDTGHIRSELALPLLSGDELLGVLDVQSPRLRAFTEADVDMLGTVADGLSIALENARLLVRERRSHTDLQLILEVSRAANASLVLDDVIQRVAEGIADAVGLPSCIIYLYDDEMDRLLPSAFVARDGSELDTTRVSQVIPSTENSQLLRRILFCGHEACAIDMLTCEVDDSLARVLSASAVLAVPFVVKQQFLGIALIVAHDVDYHFDDDQLRLAAGVADTAALALENARLYARSHTLGMAEERIRVARDIHDGMAQGLTAITLNLEAADQMIERKPEKARAKVQRGLELARATLEQARRSVLDLHASALQELTLSEAMQRRLQQSLDDGREWGLGGSFDADGMYGRLSSRLELSLYRIFEEALDNVRRHAEATWVSAMLSRDGDDVVLTVADNGRGFEVESALAGQSAPGAFGLVAVRERVRLLHGTLQVESGNGTTLIVTVPFEPQEPSVSRDLIGTRLGTDMNTDLEPRRVGKQVSPARPFTATPGKGGGDT